jgi:predicted metalloprotease with PDZ domain
MIEHESHPRWQPRRLWARSRREDEGRSRAEPAPSEWLRRSGHQLIFTDTPTEAFTSHEERTSRVDLSHSLGVVLRGGASGEVSTVIWDGPAFTAGIVAGATIRSVNDGAYDPEKLLAAIRNNRDGGSPIRLGVISRDRERVVTIDYQGGLRFPRLERVSGMPDRLGALLSPRASVPHRSTTQPP